MRDMNNIYLAARMAASKRDKRFANRERAAECLHVSAEALADYENGITLPPCDVVAWMIDVYGAPELRGRHMRACCPLMTEGLPDGGGLQGAALGWISGMDDVEALGRLFARVARDGRVNADERDAAAQIRSKAVELTRVMLESIAAIDAAMNGGRPCD